MILTDIYNGYEWINADNFTKQQILSAIDYKKGSSTMTKKQAFEYIIDIFTTKEIEYEFNEENISINDLIAFCQKELTKLNTVKKTNTKKQEQSEAVAMDILSIMEDETEYTINDILEIKQDLIGTSTSQMGAYMNILYKMGMITKGKKDKKVSYIKVNNNND